MDKIREDLSSLTGGECSLPMALEVIGERWCFMILRAALNGIGHFEDFLSEIGIARNILANRLTRMVEAGIMTRRPCDHDKRKVEYRLTDKGQDLLPTMIALRQWGERWQTGVPSNPVLCDSRDRQPIGRISMRAHDDRILEMDDLCWIDESELKSDPDGGCREDIVVRHLKEIGESSAA
ncbi:winged helix-turn-helix transcriptional regulator [Parasphingorhabdus sp.]|uniref:winged helix-turn-helix transcriptional regulator n=1 Tax=Parasphingorhabdus sp. TaxID=2709688 RepID=UPI003A941769